MRTWLAAVAAALALACGEDPVPKLEAERAALLEQTRPKAEFWSEVERKGGLAKERSGVAKELEAVRAQVAAVAAEQAQLGPALAQSRDANAQTADALARNRDELARLEREVTARAAALEGFQARTEEPAP